MFCFRNPLLLIACTLMGLVPLQTFAQGPSTRARYGNFPFSDASMRRLKRDVRKDSKMLRANQTACRAKRTKAAPPWCDAEHDKLSNLRESLLGTDPHLSDTDGDGLKDYSELIRFHTNPLSADSDGDGVTDGDEALRDHSDPLNPSSNSGCSGPNFDTNGETTQFGIPVPAVGNQSRGKQAYERLCATCHASGEPATNIFYQPLKTRLALAPMFITTIDTATLADLIAYLNRTQVGGTGNCSADPTPAPPNQNMTPTPTVTPQPTPTPSGCSNEFFNQNGDTTVFEIPSPLTGNIGRGSQVYSLACMGCHTEKGTNFTFTAIKAAVTGPLMRINTVSDQQYADLTAFLNRSKAAQNCGAPNPTPTPLDDRSAGMIVYQTTCKTCHSRASEFRTLTPSKLQEAIKEKPEMKDIKLTSEQSRVLFIYLHSL